MACGRRPKAAKVAEEGKDKTMIEEATDEDPPVDDGTEETKEAAVDDHMPIEGVEESKVVEWISYPVHWCYSNSYSAWRHDTVRYGTVRYNTV